MQKTSDSGRILRRFRRNRTAVASVVFIILLSAAAVLVPWLSPYSSGGLEETRILEGPSWEHWMGTDMLGRDLLTRVFLGARVSITVGVGTALIAMFIGTVYGLVSGYAGGSVDSFLMRLADAFYGLPDLLIFILFSLVLGRSIAGVLVALALVTWVRFARITRGQVLQTKQLQYVDAAKSMGAGHPRLLLRHILPNILGPIVVTLTFSIPAAILTESTLSFIGLGINDPYSPWGTSWGTLAQDGWRAMRVHPHIILSPALAIFLTILAFNFVGNGLRDLLDPRSR